MPLKKDSNRIKWAIVGTGHMSKIWADLVLGSKSAELHSICSRSISRAEAFGRKFGCNKSYEKVERMLEIEHNSIDCVYVATPVHSHYEIIEKCLKANISVLIEKPATPTAAQWDELTTLAKQRGVLLIEGMWMRCLPAFRQAEEWIDGGKIGSVNLIRADLHKFLIRTEDETEPVTGVLMDYGIYAIYFVCYFLGGIPDKFESYCRDNKAGNDADWAITAKRGDRTAIINLSSNFHSTSRATVIGTNGIIEWESPFNRASEVVLYSFQPRARTRKSFTYSNFGFEYQLEEVTRSLKDKKSESSILTHQRTFDALRFAELLIQKSVQKF